MPVCAGAEATEPGTRPPHPAIGGPPHLPILPGLAPCWSGHSTAPSSTGEKRVSPTTPLPEESGQKRSLLIPKTQRKGSLTQTLLATGIKKNKLENDGGALQVTGGIFSVLLRTCEFFLTLSWEMYYACKTIGGGSICVCAYAHACY